MKNLLHIITVFVMITFFSRYAFPVYSLAQDSDLPLPTIMPTDSLTPTPSIISPTPSPTPIESISNVNNATVETNSQAASVTGQNTVIQDDTAVIQTATASAMVSAVTVVNTNSSGGTANIVNISEPTNYPIDLSNPETCVFDPSADERTTQNDASIQNIIDVNALTGNNTALAREVEITTADAQAKANVFNMANTNLAGSCWSFNVINIFPKVTSDLVLPSELPIIQPSISDLHLLEQDSTSLLNLNQNNASILNTLSVTANTASNTASSIETGMATTSIQTVDKINTNITGNNWLILQIHSYARWEGSLLNWWGNVQQTPTDTFAWIQLPSEDIPSSASKNTNMAEIKNDIRVNADTGNNTTEGDKTRLVTGNASAKINLFNLANTNITGSRWYYSLVNLFDTFTGNIIFPRPDLDLSLHADRQITRPGESVNYTIFFRNTGTLTATNIHIKSSGQTVNWKKGNLSPRQSGQVHFSVQVDPNTSVSALTIDVTISTDTDEPNKTNNFASLTIPIVWEESSNYHHNLKEDINDPSISNKMPEPEPTLIPTFGITRFSDTPQPQPLKTELSQSVSAIDYQKKTFSFTPKPKVNNKTSEPYMVILISTYQLLGQILIRKYEI